MPGSIAGGGAAADVKSPDEGFEEIEDVEVESECEREVCTNSRAFAVSDAQSNTIKRIFITDVAGSSPFKCAA